MTHGPADFAQPAQLPPGQRRADFWRANHYGRVPCIDLTTWSLAIEGATRGGEVTRLRWQDIERLPRVEVTADFHCASRRSVQDVRWSGVAARSVLDLAPPAGGARFALAYGAYGYNASVRVDDLLSPRALFATHVDGEPLTPEHGWPLRLVLPHLYGWKGPKWMLSLEYLTEPRRGFWEQRGYHLVGDVWREERYAHQE